MDFPETRVSKVQRFLLNNIFFLHKLKVCLFVSVVMTAYYGYISLIFRFGVATFKFRAFTFSALISEVAGMTRGSPSATR